MRRSLAFLLLLVAAGCTGRQSALDPQGLSSAAIYQLILFIMIVCACVWLLVMIVLIAAIWRGRREKAAPTSERKMTMVISIAVGATAVVVGIFTLMSFLATRHISAPPENPLVVQVRGYQFWWEVTYVDPRPDRNFVTANEIHIPIGRPVRFVLLGGDVIHSFWVPNLAGKQDLIPGRTNELTVTANRSGTYRGQCAEFCGLQHAHMAFTVIAEDPADFDAWRLSNIETAASPKTPEAQEGLRVFAEKACVACHTIRGTGAAGTLGPDLTHMASRQYLASGLLETTRGSLAAWIADPQTLKPGSNMPLVDLEPEELQAVSTYLMGLK